MAFLNSKYLCATNFLSELNKYILIVRVVMRIKNPKL